MIGTSNFVPYPYTSTAVWPAVKFVFFFNVQSAKSILNVEPCPALYFKVNPAELKFSPAV